ncbi:MAG: SRPBCC family protein [Deltaproteobacteria bacterium]|nr:SRPBCC family protein [Deltaproteobacteria bacterium]
MPNPALPGRHQVTASLSIDAPAAETWAVVADFFNMHTWAPGISATEPLTDATTGIGAARRNVAEGFGAIDQTITDWTEGRGYVYASGAVGPFARAHTAYSIEEVDGATRASISMGFDLVPPMDTPEKAPMVRSKLEGSLGPLLDALKRRVETGERVR